MLTYRNMTYTRINISFLTTMSVIVNKSDTYCFNLLRKSKFTCMLYHTGSWLTVNWRSAVFGSYVARMVYRSAQPFGRSQTVGAVLPRLLGVSRRLANSHTCI